MTRAETAPTLDDVLARVPAEHRASLDFLRAQMAPAEAAILEQALPPLFEAIGARDYAAFEAALAAVGYGHFAYIIWTILDAGAAGAAAAEAEDGYHAGAAAAEAGE